MLHIQMLPCERVTDEINYKCIDSNGNFVADNNVKGIDDIAIVPVAGLFDPLLNPITENDIVYTGKQVSTEGYRTDLNNAKSASEAANEALTQAKSDAEAARNKADA
jgi:hypothetical protein